MTEILDRSSSGEQLQTLKGGAYLDDYSCFPLIDKYVCSRLIRKPHSALTVKARGSKYKTTRSGRFFIINKKSGSSLYYA